MLAQPSLGAGHLASYIGHSSIPRHLGVDLYWEGVDRTIDFAGETDFIGGRVLAAAAFRGLDEFSPSLSPRPQIHHVVLENVLRQ